MMGKTVTPSNTGTRIREVVCTAGKQQKVGAYTLFRKLFLICSLFVYGAENYGESLYEQSQINSERIEAIRNDLNRTIEKINTLSADEKEFRNFISSKTEDCGVQGLECIPQDSAEDIPIIVLPPLILSPEEEKQIVDSLNLLPESIPQWEDADYYYVGFVGIAAAVYDTLFSKHITKAAQGFRLPINIQKALEKYAKTPSDSAPEGRGGGGHRGYSLAHDPLLGVVFGIYDLMTGNSSTIKDGEILISPANNSVRLRFEESIVKWVAHLLSDVFTARGLPIPGWSFLQTLNSGSIGKKERTIAQIAQGMYNSGYDLRRFAVDATTPGMIEVLIQVYHYLGEMEHSKTDNDLDIMVEKERSDAKLNSMLFWAHSIATAANAGKITFYAAQPPYIINMKALMSVNIPQWLCFMKSTLSYTKAHFRPTDIEQIRRNRHIISEHWKLFPDVVFVYEQEKYYD